MSAITEDEVQQAWREARVVWQPWRPHAAMRWSVGLPLVRGAVAPEPMRRVTFSRLTRRDAHGRLIVLVVRGGTVLDSWLASEDEAPAAALATGCL
jgi:hypothetical protein